ncbi:MAG: Hsp20/alpha crystallin family protein [Calditrichaeota bacterium]|nr:MAG: Hsp20/alpha crystallin family protein [Calditrichota bacterium]
MSSKETRIKVREPEKTETVEHLREHKTFLPAVDIVETPEEFRLWVDMPGVDKKSIEVTLEKNILTIKGHTPMVYPEGFTLNYAEYEVGDYERSFTLTETINQDGIEASYDNGVLMLRLPKVDEVKPRTIPIRTS